ncbi:RepB [Ligilactobacillus acidipiscis]|nr:RepB [Ligilactobacillus acidipiscis]
MKKDHTSSSTRKLDDKVYSLQQERIADLKEQNSFYEEQIKALQKQLENSQRLVDQEQQLHLSDQKRIEKLEQPDKEQKTDTIQNNSVDNQQQNQSKKGFFKRFFGK